MFERKVMKSRPVHFYDNNNKRKLTLPGSMTIEEIVVKGLKFKVVPKEQPQAKDELRAKAQND